jgi:hypothetical protein
MEPTRILRKPAGQQENKTSSLKRELPAIVKVIEAAAGELAAKRVGGQA